MDHNQSVLVCLHVAGHALDVENGGAFAAGEGLALLFLPVHPDDAQGLDLQQTDGGLGLDGAGYSLDLGLLADLGVQLAGAGDRGHLHVVKGTLQPDGAAGAVPLGLFGDAVQQGHIAGDTLIFLQNLEKNEILGQVDSINVENPEDLTLSYEGRYEVRLGSAEQLEKKIKSMHLAIEQMSRYQTGSLDISFTTWPDEVAFTPAEKS